MNYKNILIFIENMNIFKTTDWQKNAPKETIDEDYVEYKPKKVKVEPEISKADIRIIEDIHAMKDAQRKRLMKYMEALKQIEALEDME